MRGPFTLSWEIESDGGLEFGGWNIDDVCVYRPIAEASEDTGEAGGGEDSGEVDDVVPDGSGSPAGVDASTGGCGCDAGGSAGTGALALALALAARRRR